MTVRFLSVCSGIEAASVAVDALGWQAVGFAEIDTAASRVLAHRFGSNLPGEELSRNGVPNFGDFTQIDLSRIGPVDVLVGGTPCQAFSVAGKRLSLADARGNLSLAYTVLAHELARSHGLRNAWWENVPGVLNTADNAFGCFLSGLVGADDPLCTPDGEGWPDAGLVAGPRARVAWRVLDAQYFGLAQRRKRVFVVADFGNGADPSKVLFERKGVRGNPKTRRETRQGAAGTAAAGAGIGFGGGNCSGPIDQAACLTAKGVRQDFEVETFIAQPVANTLSAARGKASANAADLETYVAHALRGEGFDASEDGTGRGTPIVPVPAPTLRSMGHAESHANAGGQLAVAFDLRGREGGAQFEGPHDTANIRAASGGSSRSYVAQQWAVRRLTPTECCRLQGFPDDWNLVPDAKGKPMADGPRYRQLGNSMAVNVMRFIGERMDQQLRSAFPHNGD